MIILSMMISFVLDISIAKSGNQFDSFRESVTDGMYSRFQLGSSSGSGGNESACSTGETGSVPGLGRFPEEGSGYLLQCSCLDRSLAGYGPWGHKESYTTDPLTVSLFFSNEDFIYLKE